VEGRRADRSKRDPSDEQLLAAVRRATRQRRPRPGPAPLWMLLEHLAIPRRSGAARGVRRRLEELGSAGLLARGCEHSLAVWSLTPAGSRALDAAGAQALPESPRRRAWRRARAAAAQELPRFRAQLAAALAEAELMLDRAGEDGPRSQEWLALGRRLGGACRRVASAEHCLHEWREPAEDAPAAEPAELAALRNIRLWREPD
jgi:hypothetical protein